MTFHERDFPKLSWAPVNVGGIRAHAGISTGTESDESVDALMDDGVLASSLVVSMQRRATGPLPDHVAMDFLRANASLFTGISSCWAVDPRDGGLRFRSAIHPVTLTDAMEGVGAWLAAVSQCFADTCSLIESSAGAEGSDVLIAACALPIAEFRARISRRGRNVPPWHECVRQEPAWRGPLIKRWPDAVVENGMVLWTFGESVGLSVRAHSWAGVDEAEVRLIESAQGELLGRTGGPLQALAGCKRSSMTCANLAGTAIENNRLVRIWRIGRAEDTIAAVDKLIGVLHRGLPCRSWAAWIQAL